MDVTSGGWLRRWLESRKAVRELQGAPCSPFAVPLWMIHDRWKWGAAGKYVARSRRVRGWTRGEEAAAVAMASAALPDDAVILENGCFLGCSTVLLAGPRKLRRSGVVHAVDPFDASGESFSAPIYRAAQRSLTMSLRERFEVNIAQVGLTPWVQVHQGLAHHVAATWSTPIDIVFLDGDHSYEGARAAFACWAPFLKPGAVLAVHNSAPGVYAPGHDGSRRLVEEVVRPPRFIDVRNVGTTTFAHVPASGSPLIGQALSVL